MKPGGENKSGAEIKNAILAIGNIRNSYKMNSSLKGVAIKY